MTKAATQSGTRKAVRTAARVRRKPGTTMKATAWERRHAALKELADDRARKVARLTDDERRELIAITNADHGLTPEAAESDLLGALMAVTRVFARRYYPGFSIAHLFLSGGGHEQTTIRLGLPESAES